MATLMNVNPNMAMGPGADNNEGSVNRTYYKHFQMELICWLY